jgi:small subunit ribosomal protein S18
MTENKEGMEAPRRPMNGDRPREGARPSGGERSADRGGDRGGDRGRGPGAGPGAGGSGGGAGGMKPRRRFYYRKRKFCKFRAEKIDFIDYKDVELLRQFIPELGKIAPRRQTGTSSRFQRMLATAIKRARHMALLPYQCD